MRTQEEPTRDVHPPRFRTLMKVSIIIAVYNEARTVATLLDRVWVQRLRGVTKEIIIIESNSTDGSREIIAEFIARHSAESSPRIQVIHQSRPMGKGHAIRQGFAAATGEILLIQDADLEYDVADYPRLLAPIIDGRAAFVLGSRHMGPNGWKIRQCAQNGLTTAFMNFGGILFHAFFNAVFSTRLTDPTSMYKVFRSDCLNGLNFTSDRFDFDFELLGKLIRTGFRPLEVPVSYKSRGFGEGKKIRIFRDPPTWVFAILKSRFGALGAAERRSLQRVAHRNACPDSIGGVTSTTRNEHPARSADSNRGTRSALQR
jgi:glycosyltransferase involved in cell wall biosynthesis